MSIISPKIGIKFVRLSLTSFIDISIIIYFDRKWSEHKFQYFIKLSISRALGILSPWSSMYRGSPLCTKYIVHIFSIVECDWHLNQRYSNRNQHDLNNVDVFCHLYIFTITSFKLLTRWTYNHLFDNFVMIIFQT